MNRGAISHPVAIVGVVLTTAAAVVFLALAIAMAAGMLENPYAGLVVFIAVPALFLIGLLLIPIGVRLRRRQLERHPDAVADWPVVDFRVASVRRTALMIAALTAANIVIVLLAGYGTLHWMESPQFCGQVCHTPMQPQHMALGSATHSKIACVSCHIGEGASGFAHAKMAGVRQLVHVATNSIPRPVPPGVDIPGGQAQTCRRCHQPERPVGDVIRVIREYADDEANTESMTVLQMHVDRSMAPRAIHWHADPSVKIEYVSTDAARQTIPYVKVTDAKGQVREYLAEDATDQMIGAGHRRTMECADCHNAVGHPIGPTPEKAVDQAMATAMISRDLPYVRREGLQLVKAEYPDQDAAVRAIEDGLRNFYKSNGGVKDEASLTRSIAGLQDVYRRNVFPSMKVTWDTYPDNKGHVTSNGCFRCHDDSHKTKDGAAISADCDYCHTQIER